MRAVFTMTKEEEVKKEASSQAVFIQTGFSIPARTDPERAIPTFY